VHDILTKPVRGEQLLASLPAMKLGPGQSHQVMMVDDDRGALKLADRMLRQRGYEAVCHSTAKAALRAARQRVPAAVILDLNMPELDGFQFLEQFRRQSDTRRIPVIVWSDRAPAKAPACLGPGRRVQVTRYRHRSSTSSPPTRPGRPPERNRPGESSARLPPPTR
jgi:CheY-like chemotaxis protein